VKGRQRHAGKTFTIPLHTTRNTSAGSGRADGGTLPTAGQQGYVTAVVPNAYVYGQIQVTGPTIRAARDNAGAFVTAIESEITGLTRDTKKAVNRQLHGDGRDALAIWTDTDGATPSVVDDGQGNAFVHLPTSGTITCDVYAGTTHDAYTAFTTKLTGGDSVIFTLGAKAAANYAISWSTGAITTPADGDYLVMEDTHGYQMMGIRGIIDDADPPLLAAGLHGLDVATYPWWKAQMFGASGVKRDLTLALMQDPISAIAVNSDFTENDIAFLLGNYGVRDKYVSLLVADKRFVNTMKLDGGFTGVEFNGIPFVVDPQCRRNTIWYIVPESMRIYRTSDFDWMDRDGSTLARTGTSDAYNATLVAYMNLGCHARNANAALEDITD